MRQAGQASSVLVDTMDSELHRAMNSLGSTGRRGAAAEALLPQLLRSPTANRSASARSSARSPARTQSHRRFADVQVRIGTPAEDNTHGDHRNSALTTIPLPLTDDRAAIARSLWFATNRGYGKALDGYLKVKTEQQVRAKEEDGSPDFSTEEPKVALLPPPPPLTIDRAAWEARLRELSGIFKQYPDVFYNTVALEASSETDYFVSSEGAKVATPNHVARLVDRGPHPRRGWHGPVPRRDLRGRRGRPSARPEGARREDRRDGQEPRSTARRSGHRALSTARRS